MNQTASNVSCLAPLVACLVLATVAFADSTNAVPPTLFQPVVLKDADGNAELDLVDPFRRRGADEEASAEATAEDGLMRTTMGEISSEFRILAITIPQDTNTPRAALIQFHDADEPILVHEGDLVRVDRTGVAGRGRAGKPSRPRASANARNSLQRGQSGRAASPRPQFPVSPKSAGQDADLEEQLKKFVFYVNVKHIEPTFIEVYHNKKRPDETIRLNW